MTISSTVSRADFIGSGIAGPYAYPFLIFAAADLTVVTRTASGVETTLSYPADYVITGVGNAAGGSITLTTALAAGDFLALVREVSPIQTTSLRNQSTFFPSSYESALDYRAMAEQTIADAVDRSFRLPVSVDPDSVDVELPLPVANYYLGWNADGDALENKENPTAGSGLPVANPVATGYLTVPETVISSGAVIPDGTVPGEAYNEYYNTADAAFFVKQNRESGLTDAFGWTPRHPPAPIQVAQGAGTSYTAFGDSVSVGNFATTPSVGGFCNLIAKLIGATFVNRALGSRGVHYCIEQVFANEAIPRAAGSLYTWMAGFNDVNANPAVPPTKTIAKIKSVHRAFMAHSIAATAVPASDISVTLSGSWTTFAPAGAATKASYLAGGTAKQASTGSLLGWTFSGDSLIIGTWVCDGVTYTMGPFTVTVDGVVLASFDPMYKTDGIPDGGGYNNGREPDAIVLTGLGAGSHSLVITPLTGVACVVDYLGTALSTSAALPSLVGMMIRAAFPTVAAANVTDANVILACQAIHDVVGEFAGYPIQPVYVNAYYNVSTGARTDGIHPTDLGHAQLAAGFMDRIKVAGVENVTAALGLTSYRELAAGVASGSGAIAGTGGTATGLDSSASLGGKAFADHSTAVGVDAEATAGQTTAIGNISRATAADATALGEDAQATGAQSSAGGRSSRAGGASSSAWGYGASAPTDNSTAVGRGAVAGLTAGTKTLATAVGYLASAAAQDATAVGASSSAAQHGTAVGRSAAAAIDATAVGFSASAPAGQNTAVGVSAAAGNATGPITLATAIGDNASALFQDSLAVGASASVTAGQGTAIGRSAVADTGGVAVGKSVQALGPNAVAIGIGAVVAVGHTNSAAIGTGAVTTASNQIRLGTVNENVLAPGNVTLAGAGKAVGFYGVAAVARAAAITSPTAPSAGYVQAEAAAMKTAVDAVLAALTNLGLTS